LRVYKEFDVFYFMLAVFLNIRMYAPDLKTVTVRPILSWPVPSVSSPILVQVCL